MYATEKYWGTTEIQSGIALVKGRIKFAIHGRYKIWSKNVNNSLDLTRPLQTHLTVYRLFFCYFRLEIKWIFLFAHAKCSVFLWTGQKMFRLDVNRKAKFCFWATNSIYTKTNFWQFRNTRKQLKIIFERPEFSVRNGNS